jgi:hypothetical protein
MNIERKVLGATAVKCNVDAECASGATPFTKSHFGVFEVASYPKVKHN